MNIFDRSKKSDTNTKENSNECIKKKLDKQIMDVRNKQHKRLSSNLAELRTSLLQKLPRPKNKFRMKIIEEYYKQIRSKREVLFYTIKLKLNACFLVRKKTCQSLT